MIEAGPIWQDDTGEDGRVEPKLCAACCEMGYVDKKTGLCRPCWRPWRFGSNARWWADARNLLIAIVEAIARGDDLREKPGVFLFRDARALVFGFTTDDAAERGEWYRQQGGAKP